MEQVKTENQRIKAFVYASLRLDDIDPQTPVEQLKQLVLNRLTAKELKLSLDIEPNQN